MKTIKIEAGTPTETAADAIVRAANAYGKATGSLNGHRMTARAGDSATALAKRYDEAVRRVSDAYSDLHEGESET